MTAIRKKSKKRTVASKIKKYLITGVLIWLPIIAGVWTINYIVTTSDHLIRLIPREWQPEHLLGHHIPGLGIVLALLILLITGVFAGNIIGKKVVRLWDSFFGHIPVVKTVYTGVKKVSESLLSDSSKSFKTPLLVQFPHQGVWTIAFVSGSLPDEIRHSLQDDNDEFLPVYVPTTPNPTGGYYIMVRRADTRPLNLSVDEALKYIISLGMVMPELLPEQLEQNDDDDEDDEDDEK
ncbi:MAG: DUF502 domain-containing protein [Neisseriaceae bacterium]|nr:DUF502 domain-containing protein [Neisseriaceae bacterium]MBR5940344.1 DUF502 domain-containing protein [Neisseriaceae bacterium]